MNLKDLHKPFPAEEIEWRIAQARKYGDRISATCLAYVQARAIMNRLDEVCGPENWKASYTLIPGSQGMEPGVICHLSIKCGDEWVTKEDGAEQTDIESFKGGISGALKRAAVLWGIGRYLYALDQGYATIVEKGTKGAKYARSKDAGEFFWIPPALPSWALPEGQSQAANGTEESSATKAPALTSIKVKPSSPGPNDGLVDPGTYCVTIGEWRDKSIRELYETVGPKKLADKIAYLEKSPPLKGGAADFVKFATMFLGRMENKPLYPVNEDIGFGDVP